MLLRFVSSPLFICEPTFVFEKKNWVFFPFVLFGAIERKMGKESRQFLVDIFDTGSGRHWARVFFRDLKGGLRASGFGPVSADLVVVFFALFCIHKSVGYPPDECAHL